MTKKNQQLITVFFFLLGYLFIPVSCLNMIDQEKFSHTNPYDSMTEYPASSTELITSSAAALVRLGPHEIEFSWAIDQGAHFSHYNVYSRRAPAAWQLKRKIFERGENSFWENGLVAMTIYHYRVEAVDKKGRTNTVPAVSYMTSPLYSTKMEFKDQAAYMGVGEIKKLFHLNGRYYFLYYGAEPTYGNGGPLLYSNTSVTGAGEKQNLFMMADDTAVFGGTISRYNVLFRQYDPLFISNDLMNGIGEFNYPISNKGALHNKNISDFFVYETAAGQEALIILYELYSLPLVGYLTADLQEMYTNQTALSEVDAKTNVPALISNLYKNNAYTNPSFAGYDTSAKNPLKFADNSAAVYCLFSTISGTFSPGMDLSVSKVAFTGNPANGTFDFHLPAELGIIASVVNAVPSVTNGYAYDNLGAQITGFEVTDDYIYIANGYRGYILQFAINGDYLRTIGSAGTRFGEFAFISDILSFENKLFVCDRDNQRVQIFDEEGIFISSVGISGISEYGFVSPTSISVLEVAGKKMLHVADKHWIKEFELGNLVNL